MVTASANGTLTPHMLILIPVITFSALFQLVIAVQFGCVLKSSSAVLFSRTAPLRCRYIIDV